MYPFFAARPPLAVVHTHSCGGAGGYREHTDDHDDTPPSLPTAPLVPFVASKIMNVLVAYDVHIGQRNWQNYTPFGEARMNNHSEVRACVRTHVGVVEGVGRR